ncbi:MAG: hypothetical protein NZ570_07420 [Candidatus Caldarchaeum sp.]|nr:hypothetical protein [Candidatus Caldarchaeum sp.]
MKKGESSMTHGGGTGGSSAKTSTGYCTVKIPLSLARALDSYLMEEEAELRGFRSRADVVVSLLVGFLEEQGVIKTRARPRLEHVNVYETHVLVRDNLLEATAEVWLERSRIYCGYCHLEDCVHVCYALSLDVVRERLEAEGVKLPKPRGLSGGMVVMLDDVVYPFSTE